MLIQGVDFPDQDKKVSISWETNQDENVSNLYGLGFANKLRKIDIEVYTLFYVTSFLFVDIFNLSQKDFLIKRNCLYLAYDAIDKNICPHGSNLLFVVFYIFLIF